MLPFAEYVARLDRKRNSAAAVFHDPHERVLLVETTYKTHFELPGGVVEAGEAPWQAVAREVREELGLRRRFDAPAVIDHTPDEARLPEGLAWIFDGGPITADEVDALELTSPEIQAVGLYDRAALAERATPPLAARIDVALAAISAGRLVLCERGQPVT